jgi:2-dehydropantoate 2-reductase
VEDPRPAIWRKLAINAMVNTTAALTGMRNGELRQSPWVRELMAALGREALLAASRDGVDLDFDQIWSFNLKNLENSVHTKASMLQDVQAGRQTEIEAISGGVLRHALNDGEFPYTRAVYALLKAIEAHNGD